MHSTSTPGIYEPNPEPPPALSASTVSTANCRATKFSSWLRKLKKVPKNEAVKRELRRIVVKNRYTNSNMPITFGSYSKVSPISGALRGAKSEKKCLHQYKESKKHLVTYNNAPSASNCNISHAVLSLLMAATATQKPNRTMAPTASTQEASTRHLHSCISMRLTALNGRAYNINRTSIIGLMTAKHT